MLEKKIDTPINWKPEILVDPLVGSAEQMNRLMNKVINIKKKNNWDYVICLTDLPQFMEKHIIMADINREQKVALVSLPAFGLFPIKKRISNKMIRKMNFGNADYIQNKSMQSRKTFREQKKHTAKGVHWPIQRVAISRVTEANAKKEEASAEDIHKKDKNGDSNKNEE